MSYWPAITLVLAVVCTTAQSQQTESEGLKLNLEQFEQPAQQQPAGGSDGQLQLNLEQFNDKTNEQQGNSQKSDELELNLEKFDRNSTGQTPTVNAENTGAGQRQTGSGNGDSGIGKMNNTGSAASRVEDSDGTLSSDDRYLIKTGLWFLVIAIPIFLLMRSRLRRRNRQRPNRRVIRTTYDEENHR